MMCMNLINECPVKYRWTYFFRSAFVEAIVQHITFDKVLLKHYTYCKRDEIVLTNLP